MYKFKRHRCPLHIITSSHLIGRSECEGTIRVLILSGSSKSVGVVVLGVNYETEWTTEGWYNTYKHWDTRSYPSSIPRKIPLPTRWRIRLRRRVSDKDQATRWPIRVQFERGWRSMPLNETPNCNYIMGRSDHFFSSWIIHYVNNSFNTF